MATTPDPRRTVTPDAFQVAPELLGLPLAGPWRRLAAMLVDLLVLAFLVNAGGVLLALAAAVILFRAPARGQRSLPRRGVRLLLRGAGALLLFIAVLSVWGQAGRVLERLGGDPPPPGAAEATGEVRLSGRQALALLSDWGALARAGSQEEAAPTARRVVQRARAAGMSDEELRELAASGPELQDIRVPEWSAAALVEAVREAVGESAAAEAAEPASDTTTEPLVRAYLSALEEGDSAAMVRAGALLAPRIASDTLRKLEEGIARAQRDAAATERRLQETRDRLRSRSGVRWFFSFLADDLGLGFGWAGLYFTAFLALWRGRTPGKRLLGMQVIRLDGKPLGWWASFERFGGYGASIVTGLLGFAEILWDRNRQGMHDKIARTVVVRT